MTISVLIPCHNEEKSIRKCVESCLTQTRKPDQILVINDGSTDKSAAVLAEFGDLIDVLTIPKATGNKSRAQERGIPHVTSDVFVATDGDTILEEHFIEEVEKALESDPTAVGVCGYVKSLKYNWLTACREIEYVIGQDLYKVAQSYLQSIFVIPGCAGAFRTDVFRKYMQFDHDTLTEDLDFTFKFHAEYLKIAYTQKAISYTQDPGTFASYVNQIRRWYCGGWQNLRKHAGIMHKPNNSLQLSAAYIEGFIFSLAIFLFPLVNFSFFLWFITPALACLLVLGAYAALRRRRWDLLLYSPMYIILIYVNSFIFLEQFVKEIVLRHSNMFWYQPTRREI